MDKVSAIGCALGKTGEQAAVLRHGRPFYAMDGRFAPWTPDQVGQRAGYFARSTPPNVGTTE